jgi:hypothetical protein
MVQNMPAAMPYVLRIIQWVISAFRGSSDIESVLDEAVKEATNAPPPQEQKEADAPQPQELELEAVPEGALRIEALSCLEGGPIDLQALAIELPARIAPPRLQSLGARAHSGMTSGAPFSALAVRSGAGGEPS